MFGSKVYKKSPKFIQEYLISARGWAKGALRDGALFEKFHEEFVSTQWLGVKALEAYRLNELKQSMSFVESNVPFYRRQFQKYGFRPENIRGEADLRRLPLMEKADVREAGSELLPKSSKRRAFPSATSGTTGTPLRLYQDLHAINRENAFIWRQLSWAGFLRGERRAWIRGDMVVPAGRNAPPFCGGETSQRTC